MTYILDEGNSSLLFNQFNDLFIRNESLNEVERNEELRSVLKESDKKFRIMKNRDVRKIRYKKLGKKSRQVRNVESYLTSDNRRRLSAIIQEKATLHREVLKYFYYCLYLG